MANKIKTGARIVDMGSAVTENVLINNGDSWNAGALLRTDTSGLLVELATGADVAAGGCSHMALTTVTDPGNNTTYAPVVRIASDTVFEVSVHHDTAASALAPASIIGQQYGLDVSNNANSVSVHTVDLEETTAANLFWQVTEIASNYNPGENTVTDQYGLVRAKILNTVLDAVKQA
jgi:hypothetical protein